MTPRVRELGDGTVRVDYGLDQRQRFHSEDRAYEFVELLEKTMALHREVENFVRLHAITDRQVGP